MRESGDRTEGTTEVIKSREDKIAKKWTKQKRRRGDMCKAQKMEGKKKQTEGGGGVMKRLGSARNGGQVEFRDAR